MVRIINNTPIKLTPVQESVARIAASELGIDIIEVRDTDIPTLVDFTHRASYIFSISTDDDKVFDKRVFSDTDIHTNVSVNVAMSVIGAIQLASRNPCFIGTKSCDISIRYARELQSILETILPTSITTILELGWNPDFDTQYV